MLRKLRQLLSVRRKGSFYRKSLILFLITASIPGLIIGGCIYWFAVGQIERDLSSLHQRQIEERAQNIDDQFSYLELDLSHWAFNPRFGSALRDLNFVYHFEETYDITKTLLVLQGSHPLISQVQLYIDREQPVLFKPEHYRVKDPGLAASYELLLLEERNIYWTNESDDPLVLVHKVPGDSATPFGVLTLKLQRDKIIRLLETMTPYNEGATLLLDERGDIMISDSGHDPSIDALLRSEVLKRDAASGAFLYDWQGSTYTVSYGKLRRIAVEWTYISASPLTAVTSPVIAITRTIVIISATGLLAALLLSWMASLRMYTPIERLIGRFTGDRASDLRSHGMDEFVFFEKQWSLMADESLSLHARLKEQLPHVRSSFLLQLLQGHLYAYSDSDVRDRLKGYGWSVEDRQFHILHFRLTGYDSFKGRYAHGDESLVSFAASNIIDELAAEKLQQFSVLNFHDLSVAVLIVSPSGDCQSEALELLATEMMETINRIIKMQVTVTISRPVMQVQHIAQAFMEVEQSTGYRKIASQNQLLNLEKLPLHPEQGQGQDEAMYPFALERDILQAMRLGDMEEAAGLISQFLQQVLQEQGTEMQVQQSMLQLLGSMLHIVLQSGMHLGRLYNGANLFQELSLIREPAEMLRWMKEVVAQPFIEAREARSNFQLKRMVEETMEYIHQHYMNDLSLDICADRIGTNPYTLSKCFKQVSGVNFIDYVTELRISKAKELLRETDIKINMIAERVGYQPRYFNRLFKKLNDLTPGQYREQYEMSSVKKIDS